MIEYRLDKHTHAKANSQIRDMAAVLDEIAPSLNVLNTTLSQHKYAINSPAIDRFRTKLQLMILEAMDLTKKIAEEVQRLQNVSEQAAKHLATIDDHFEAALSDKPLKNPPSKDRVPVEV